MARTYYPKAKFPYGGVMMRSGTEVAVAAKLDSLGIKWEYEQHKIDFVTKVQKGICMECESHNVFKERTYTPDFWLPDYGFFIEVKGLWDSSDRSTHNDIHKCQPDLDIRFVFEKDNKISKASKTTYTGICKKLGIPCFVVNKESILPEDWFE